MSKRVASEKTSKFCFHNHFVLPMSLFISTKYEVVMNNYPDERNASVIFIKIFLLSQQNRIIQFGFAEKYARLVIQTIKDKNIHGTLKNSSRHTG